MGGLAELVGIRPALWIGLGVAVTAPLFLLPLWRVKAAPESARGPRHRRAVIVEPPRHAATGT